MNKKDDVLISQAEAGRILKVSRNAIYGRIKRGTLRHKTVGGRRFVYRADIEAIWDVGLDKGIVIW